MTYLNIKNLILSYFFLPFLLFGQLPQKVVICGVCKDIEKELPYSKKIIESIGELFTDYRIVIYENNSLDNTVEELKKWEELNCKVSIKSEFLSQGTLDSLVINRTNDGKLFRPELIARARNIVLKEALSSKYIDFPYIIWMDMDFIQPPNLNGFIETFTTDRDWDAVFAYGIAPDKRYWDWYAMRSEEYPFGVELLGETWYQMGAKRENSIYLTEKDDWLPVYSAFGGCGIYKKSSIKKCYYSGLITEDMERLIRRLIDIGIKEKHPQACIYQEELINLDKQKITNLNLLDNIKPDNSKTGFVLYDFNNPVIWRADIRHAIRYPGLCEHVPFHASMIINGHDKLFINPRLIFRYGN